MFCAFKRRIASLKIFLYFSQAEKIDIEEKYASLKEEAVGKSKKLKKVWNMLMAAKSEVIFVVYSSLYATKILF